MFHYWNTVSLWRPMKKTGNLLIIQSLIVFFNQWMMMKAVSDKKMNKVEMSQKVFEVPDT